MILILYILSIILQIWFIRNTIINWYNHEITYKNWNDTCTYSAMGFAYLLCFIPFISMTLIESEYWTLKYVKPIKRK